MYALLRASIIEYRLRGQQESYLTAARTAGLKPQESPSKLTLFLESQSCTHQGQKMRQSERLGLLCFCQRIISVLSAALCLLPLLVPITVTSAGTQQRHWLNNRFTAAFASAALDIDYDVLIDKWALFIFTDTPTT